MKFASLFLVVSTVLSGTFAVTAPSACKDGDGRTKFVCAVIDNINNDSAEFKTILQNANLSVATNGQAAFFGDLGQLIGLTRSLRTKINEQNSSNRQLSRFLARSGKQLDDASTKAANLYFTAISSVQRMQSSLNNAQSKIDNTTAEVLAKANALEFDFDREDLRNAVNSYKADLKRCAYNYKNELESLQNKTEESVVDYHSSEISVLYTIGDCVEKNLVAKCTRDAQVFLNSLNSLPVQFTLAAVKFNLLGAKSFEGYPCTKIAATKFSIQTNKILRVAKTTTAAPASSTASTQSVR